MKRRLCKEVVQRWNADVGGLAEATDKVRACLKCSPSKAEKIASGHYPSTPSALERIALANLIGVEESKLFCLPKGMKKSQAS